MMGALSSFMAMAIGGREMAAAKLGIFEILLFRSLVSLVWNELDQPRRAELVQRIERLAAGLDGTKRLGVETIYLQLAPAVGLPIAARVMGWPGMP